MLCGTTVWIALDVSLPAGRGANANGDLVGFCDGAPPPCVSVSGRVVPSLSALASRPRDRGGQTRAGWKSNPKTATGTCRAPSQHGAGHQCRRWGAFTEAYDAVPCSQASGVGSQQNRNGNGLEVLPKLVMLQSMTWCTCLCKLSTASLRVPLIHRIDHDHQQGIFVYVNAWAADLITVAVAAGVQSSF